MHPTLYYSVSISLLAVVVVHGMLYTYPVESIPPRRQQMGVAIVFQLDDEGEDLDAANKRNSSLF